MTRVAYCWHTYTCECDWPNGECICGDPFECGAALEWRDGRWHCPEGHPLRQYGDLSKRTRDRITYTQTDPSMHRRFFGDPR